MSHYPDEKRRNAQIRRKILERPGVGDLPARRPACRRPEDLGRPARRSGGRPKDLGGMGVVYKAQDTKLDRLVALKFLPQQITRQIDVGQAVSEEDKASFLQEARAISALNHPNIATNFDIDEVKEQKFLGLEYIPGGTLKSKRIGLHG